MTYSFINLQGTDGSQLDISIRQPLVKHSEQIHTFSPNTSKIEAHPPGKAQHNELPTTPKSQGTEDQALSI